MRFSARTLRNRLFLLAATAILLLLFAGSALAIPQEEMRTVYMISDVGDAGDTYVELQAYIAFGNELILAESWQVLSRGNGAVGLAVDETNEFLFLAFEDAVKSGSKSIKDDEPIPGAASATKVSDSIDVFDARSADFITSIQLPGTEDLAGMVVHQDRGHLYVVDRSEPDIFVFDINNNFLLIEHWTMPVGDGAWGIDLYGDILYVTDVDQGSNGFSDNSRDIRWFNIDTYQQLGHIQLPYNSTSIVVMDHPTTPANGPTIFIGGYDGRALLFGGGCVSGCYELQRYDVGTGWTDDWSYVFWGYTKGVSANPALDLVYLAQSGSLFVISANGTELNEYTSGVVKPTDVLATQIPFGGSVSKTCPSHPTGLIPKGDRVTFEVKIENKAGENITIVPLEDVFDTSQLTFVSASVSPNSAIGGSLVWYDLTTTLGDITPNNSIAVTITFDATETCTADLEGMNLAKVEDGRTASGGPIFAAGVFDYTIECICTSQGDCDNGDYCDGLEVCDIDGTCKAGTAPCSDDGLYCNGVEGCNETLNQCTSGTAPCANDGLFCNGTETCDEGSDQCTHSGTPCPDDGQFCTGNETCSELLDRCNTPTPPCQNDGLFCNGVESCNEVIDQCNSAGDPCTDDGVFCNGTETCNETLDRCDSSGDPCPDDGFYCNGGELCNESSDQCEYTADPCPDDGAWCNGTEGCNEASDQCTHTGDPCTDDGTFCNGTESCNEASDQCNHSGDPCPNDGAYCNGVESCNETSDQCNTTGDPCPTDGAFCNGTEGCDEGSDQCTHSGDPCPDDGFWCNGAESCNEGSDICDTTGNPCPADDGLWCNGGESCDEKDDECVTTLEPCPDDSTFCNGEEGCDEDVDTCTTTGNPCPDDSLWCNGDESCDEENLTCNSSGNPCQDDGLFCNGNEGCDDESDACISTGDPCPPDETCEEETGECTSADGFGDDDDSDDDDEAPGEDEDLWPEGQVSGGCCGC
jgi:hypothetical protein